MAHSELSPEEIEALEKILKFVEEKEQKYKEWNVEPPVYFDWQEVGIHWRILQKLRLKDIIQGGIGGKRKSYYIENKEDIKKLIEYSKSMITNGIQKAEQKTEEIKIPQDLFDIIVGFDDIKQVILSSINSDKPVHVLLIGPPASAKSLFLMEIERLPDSYFITAGTSTKVGIRDLIFERLPRYLLIDEIDKLSNPKDISALLTWMETGRIIVTKHNIHETREGKGWIFGAGNRMTGLPQELLSRFLVFKIPPYSSETFIRVVTNVLVKREGKNEDIAKYIAEKVSVFTRDVRDAIKIARLSQDKKSVDSLIQIIRKYS